MNFAKVRILKNGQPTGRAYTYRSLEELQPGDKVELDGGKHGIVVDETVDAGWIMSYGADEIKQIIRKVEDEEK